MRTQTLYAAFLALTMALAVVPTVKAHTISCSSNPCATTLCIVGRAEAHGYGDEYSWAEAHAGGWDAYDEGVGHSHADAADTGSTAVSAWAKAKKDWSLDEDISSCNGPGFAVVGLPSGIVGVGCVADDSITTTESFAGRIYAGPAGLVAYDSARGAGLMLESASVVFNGHTLERLVPMDVSTMVPTSFTLGVDLVDGGEDGGDVCASRLVQ